MTRSNRGLLAMATALILGCLANPAVSQSFDCAKASDATETTICNYPLLGELDTGLADVYRAALSANKSEGTSDLRAAQRHWIAQRNACGNDVACIKNAYIAQIDSLTKNYGLFPGWAGTYTTPGSGGLEIQISGTPDAGYKVEFSGGGANYTCGPVSGAAQVEHGELHASFGDGMSIAIQPAGGGLFVPDTEGNQKLQSSTCGEQAPQLAGAIFVRGSD